MIDSKPIRHNENTTRLIQDLKISAKQYPTLSKAQEQELIDTYKSDPDKLRELLQLHNIRLVFSMAKTYASRSADFDEMVMRGMQGLAEAASRFDIKRKLKFSTFAYMWIFKYIMQEFHPKALDKKSRTVSLDASIGREKDEDGATLENFINNDIVQSTPCYASMMGIEDDLSAKTYQDVATSIRAYIASSSKFDEVDNEIFERVINGYDSAKTVSVDLDIPLKEVNTRKRCIIESVKDMLKNQMRITSMADM